MESTLKRWTLFFLTMTLVLLLTSCSYERKDPVTNLEFEEKHLFTLTDGCKVSKVRAQEMPAIYRIKCPDGSGGGTHSCGKNCTLSYSTEPKLSEEQEVEVRKIAALLKLTPSEKQLLGLMPEQPKENK